MDDWQVHVLAAFVGLSVGRDIRKRNWLCVTFGAVAILAIAFLE